MSAVNVRYIVDDAEAAISFYTTYLDFELEFHPDPGFAILSRNSLRLLLNEPGSGGAGQTTSDGRKPEPGGWSRIQLEVEDLDRYVENLKLSGATFRNEIVTGRGGKQILVEDPSGNPIELLQPKKSSFTT